VNSWTPLTPLPKLPPCGYCRQTLYWGSEDVADSHINTASSPQYACLLQVVDFFGFGLPDVKKEVMSMHHSHDDIHRLIPQVGDSMVTNLRRPIFTLLEDTGPGVHDTTVAACDQYLYQQQLGVVSKLTDSFSCTLNRIAL